MKNWMLALSLVAVLGLSGLADARVREVTTAKHGGGIHGKIESVGPNSFTITLHHHHRKNATTAPAAPAAAAETLTIHFDGTTSVTINGVAGKIDASMVGKHVQVVGTRNGNDVTSSSITVSDGHGKHKKPAA